jgi:PAS domain-containing protein
MVGKKILFKPIDPGVMRAVGLYLAFGLLWIIASDTVGGLLLPDVWSLTRVQSLKGVLFVLCTGFLLATLMLRHQQALQRSYALLREKHRRLRTLLSNLPGMAYRCANDPQWTMSYVSPGCRRLTGYFNTDLQQNRVVAYGDLIHPEDREGVWRRVQDALDERVPHPGRRWTGEMGLGAGPRGVRSGG